MMRKLSSFVGLTCCLVLVWQFSLGAEDKLVIMSPHWEGIEKEFDRNFKEWYKSKTGRGIRLDWIDQGGSSSDFRFIEAEFKRAPKGIGIDLFFGGGTDNYMKLAEMGLLHSFKLPGEELNRIPKEIYGIPVYDSQYRWYGAALSSFGIMHNEFLRQRLKLPEAKTWQDLTQPELLGRIGAADPRESGSAHMIYEIILQGYGWQKGFALITQLGANVRSFSAGANAIPKDVVKGQVIYGMAIDFYAYAQIAVVGKEKIKFVIPPDAAVVSPDSIAILVGAENLGAAKEFVTFVLSDTAQKLWVLPNGDPEGPEWPGGLNRASVIPALYDELGERCVVPNPFTRNLTPIQYDAEKGGIRWDIVSDLIGTLVIENHKNLVEAWKAINKTKDLQKRAAAIQILGEIPITEEEAMHLSKTEWKKSDFRNRKLKEWGQFSREKFRRAKKIAK
ncbi:TPA: extracellular solute-binding protein [Candidatus Poribacteria bacterium]|nr:extracellular solute-binding protein [Candidatus Poribacteria bacterium]